MKGKIFNANRGAKVIVKCKCCKSEFEARVADVKRGWAKFCSKSCKAIKQESKTRQNAAYYARKNYARKNIDPIANFFEKRLLSDYDPHLSEVGGSERE